MPLSHTHFLVHLLGTGPADVLSLRFSMLPPAIHAASATHSLQHPTIRQVMPSWCSIHRWPSTITMNHIIVQLILRLIGNVLLVLEVVGVVVLFSAISSSS
jgi:hypothetical protein